MGDQHQLYAPVFESAFFGGVGGDGTALTEGADLEPSGVDAALDEIPLYRVGAPVRKL